MPVVANFTKEFPIPQPSGDIIGVTVYFAGSTVGNLREREAVALLRSIAERTGRRGRADIGERLAVRYQKVRTFSDTIAALLSPEDCVIQSMPDVSPTRWHLAHTRWFFETFLLARDLS